MATTQYPMWKSFKAPTDTAPLALPFEEVEYLDFMPPAKANYYQNLPANHVRTWCHYRGIYSVPTKELIHWLGEQIRGLSAIEICAGANGLGRLLGIPMTDSFHQVEEPNTAAYFAENGLVPTRPGPDVIKEDAENAVRKRKPDVVIGSWVTHKWKDGMEHGNMFGPREDYILERASKYIFIGNAVTHRSKPLLRMSHEEHYFPWLVSRAAQPSKNFVCIWHNSKPIR